MTAGLRVLQGLLEFLAPERCVVCERGRSGSASWVVGVAGSAPGLYSWHAPHLCGRCHERWRQPAIAGTVGEWPLWSALPETAALVLAVGAWKYRGVRGLARPFAALVAPVLADLARVEPGLRVAPVPLHRRRCRERGFDQCRQLAELAGLAAGVPVVADALVRRRGTAQQASCPAEGDARARNVDEAFVARPPRDDETRSLVLLDDLATTGATLAAASTAAATAGWRVTALAALGQAGRLSRRGRG